MFKNFFKLDLRHFDGGVPAAGTVSGEANTSVAGKIEAEKPKVVYGKQSETTPAANTQPATETKAPEDTPEARKARFEQYIQTEGKEFFDSRVQGIIDKRFKNFKTMEKQIKDSDPIFERLYAKYGVKDGDVEGLSRAIEKDDSYFEEEAARQGLTTEQYMRFKRLEREKAKLETEMREQERQRGAEQAYQDWLKQSDKLRETYPNFNFDAEIQNPVFANLITQPGVDLKTAYQAVHFDEILPMAMQITHEKSVEATTNNIKSRNQRPSENGITSQAGAIVKSDVTKLTAKDRREIAERVARGEKISF